MNKKLLGPALAIGLSTAACGSVNQSAAFARGSDCETKECFLENAFGVQKEGIQPSGEAVVCENEGPGVTAEDVRFRAQELFDQVHGCREADSKRKFDRVQVSTHRYEEAVNDNVSQPVNLICAMVDDTDYKTGDRCLNSKR